MRPFVPLCLVAATFFVSPDAVRGSPTAAARRAALGSTLALLHDGRFDEADDVAAGLRSAHPEDPAASFLPAFVTYWRLIYDDQNPAQKRAFEERLALAAEVSERAVASAAADPGARASLWGGYSHLLLAQLRASERKVLAAAREARAARRLLTDAQKVSPSSTEPLFGLGTYNYYAARLPALVKGLRFLVGLPGGDRDTGLAQLESCARTGDYFSLESRIVLATIYAGKHERLFEEATREAERALTLEPNSIVVLHAAARLEITLGKARAATERIAQALARAAEAPRTDASVIAALRMEQARAAFSQFRPDVALELLQPLERSPDSVPSRLRGEAARLADASRGLVAAYPQLLGASLDELERLEKARPDDAAVSLLAGRALLLLGRGADALERLDRADASGTLPGPWIGPCRLLAGEAADLTGDRARALDRYRKALEAPPFIESNAAYLYQRTPYRPAA